MEAAEILHNSMRRAAFGSITDSKTDKRIIADLKAENDQLHAVNEHHVETIRDLRAQNAEMIVRLSKFTDKPIVDQSRREPDSVNALLKKQPSLMDIVVIVAEHFDMSPKIILSQRRSRDVCDPRQVMMYLAKQLTTHSLPAIGRRLGGRDHTTVLHAVQRIEARRRDEPDLNEHLVAIEAAITKLFGDDASEVSAN